jgi:hypothetical protein
MASGGKNVPSTLLKSKALLLFACQSHGLDHGLFEGPCRLDPMIWLRGSAPRPSIGLHRGSRTISFALSNSWTFVAPAFAELTARLRNTLSRRAVMWGFPSSRDKWDRLRGRADLLPDALRWGRLFHRLRGGRDVGSHVKLHGARPGKALNAVRVIVRSPDAMGSVICWHPRCRVSSPVRRSCHFGDGRQRN